MTVLAVFLALVAVACGSSDDVTSTTMATGTVETEAPTTAVATTIAASTTSPTATLPAIDVLDARDVAAAYFEAYNEGDLDAVVAFFEPDAEFLGQFGSLTRAEWEQLLVWNLAQGTVLSPPSCLLADEFVGVSVRLVCDHGNSGAVTQAVDGPAVAIRLTMTFTPEGISDWKRTFGEGPDFNEVGIPFSEWMTTHHPDVAESVEFGNWNSVEQAERNGILTAQYGAVWRVYLDANDCGYDEDC